MDELRYMEKKPRPRGAVYATCPSVPYRMLVSQVPSKIAERIGLYQYSGMMYLRLQRERTRYLEEIPEDIVIPEGSLLKLQNFEKTATTRVLVFEPLPLHSRVNVAIVGCLEIDAFPIRVTPP